MSVFNIIPDLVNYTTRAPVFINNLASTINTIALDTTKKIVQSIQNYFDIWAGLDASARELSAFHFERYPDSEWIDLHSNNLIEITIPERSNLRMLNASNNQLERVTLPEIAKLQDLNVANNQLPEITLPEYSSLQRLNASDNELTEITIHEGSNLRVLNVANNELEHITIPKYSSLQTIDLSSNFLTELILPDHVVPDETDLRVVRAFHNHLNRITIPESSNLQELHVGLNFLTEINLPEDCPSLVCLDLSENQLPKLDIPEGSNLQHLDLFENQLTKLTIPKDSRLQSLNLSENPLINLDMPEHYSSLSFLSLVDTPLTQLPDSILSLRRDARVYTGNNSFPEGYVQEFAEKIKQHRETHPGEGPVLLGDDPESGEPIAFT
ncbi:MAG TPA: hypothetical protein VLE95_08335 [Chlamydiales bacterium]|nr:hypothetical protein [Chlamydiales bacterium]